MIDYRPFSRRTVLAGMAVAPAAASVLTLPAFAQSAPAPQGTVDLAELLAPGALPEETVGDENAPVTIVEYASMTCGHCADFHLETWPVIKEKYVDSGQVRLVFREFPFDPRAAAAFMLARCAPNDGYFPMITVLFQQQSNWARAQDARGPLENIARLAGFTQESFEACLTDQQLLDDVNAVRVRGAEEFGVNATPTFFINEEKYTGALSVDQMSAIIDSKL